MEESIEQLEEATKKAEARVRDLEKKGATQRDNMSAAALAELGLEHAEASDRAAQLRYRLDNARNAGR